MRPGRYEIWARLVWAAVDTAARAGLRTDVLFDGLPFDDASLRRLGLVAWDDYCVIVERIHAQLGSPQAYDWFIESNYHEAFPEVSALARAVVSPRLVVRLMIEALNPIVFRPVHHRFEDLGGDRVRLVHTLRPGARPCEAWFRGNIGSWRGFTRHFGLGPAEVEAEVSPEHCDLRMILPASQTIAARGVRAASRAFRVVLGYSGEHTISTTVRLAGDDPDLEVRVEEAARAHDLTPRQQVILLEIGRGRSNKEVAQLLGCSEVTVETQVTQLLRKFGVASRALMISRLWSPQDKVG